MGILTSWHSLRHRNRILLKTRICQSHHAQLQCALSVRWIFALSFVKATFTMIRRTRWILYYPRLFRFLLGALDFLSQEPFYGHSTKLSSMKWATTVRTHIHQVRLDCRTHGRLYRLSASRIFWYQAEFKPRTRALHTFV